MENMTERLRSLNLNPMTFEDCVELLAGANSMAQVYGDCLMDPPAWLEDARKSLRKELRDRRRDALEHERAEARATLDGLKTAEEKRQDARARLERIEKQLSE